jgi:calcium binding protein 39
MSYFEKARRRGIPKKLRKLLTEFQRDPSPRHSQELLALLNDFNETLNGEEFARQNLPVILNTKLYRDNTVSLLIEMIPCFDQPTLNAISTLLQTTVRVFPEHSLPQHLCSVPETLNHLVSFLEQPAVANIAHIILRACLSSSQFTKFLYESEIVGSFTRFLSGSDFDRLATGFGTYDALLNTHPDVSSTYIEGHWEIFVLQFKTLLSSPNYLMQLNFLPILTKFLLRPECRVLFIRYIDDVENLQCLMILLTNSSKRVKFQAYSLFKLFVINPRRTDRIGTALRQNQGKLCKLLTDLPLEDPDPSFEDEKNDVISILKGLK